MNKAETLQMIREEILPKMVEETAAVVIALEGTDQKAEYEFAMALYMLFLSLGMTEDAEKGALLVAERYCVLIGLDWKGVRRVGFEMIAKAAPKKVEGQEEK